MCRIVSSNIALIYKFPKKYIISKGDVCSETGLEDKSSAATFLFEAKAAIFFTESLPASIASSFPAVSKLALKIYFSSSSTSGGIAS